MTREEKAMIRGIAMALAEVQRSPPGNGVVESVLDSAGIDMAVLRQAGVEEYDRSALAPALRRGRKRSMIAARRRARSDGGGTT